MPAPLAVIGGASLVLSLLMEVYQRMKEDPEVSVQGALDSLQREQLTSFETQISGKVGRSQKRREQQLEVAQRGMGELSALRSGYLDEQLGFNDVYPQEGGLTRQFEERMGTAPGFLKERLSPRRTGDLSDMTQDLVRKG